MVKISGEWVVMVREDFRMNLIFEFEKKWGGWGRERLSVIEERGM